MMTNFEQRIANGGIIYFMSDDWQAGRITGHLFFWDDGL